MSPISFFQEDSSFVLSNQPLIVEWIHEIIVLESFRLKELNYIFCSDKYLHDLNLSYLNHDTLTDIITFDNSEVKKEIEGDIFISVERTIENAKIFNQTHEVELHRVMAHGVLHLIGYNDKTDIDQVQMQKKEQACLSLLKL